MASRAGLLNALAAQLAGSHWPNAQVGLLASQCAQDEIRLFPWQALVELPTAQGRVVVGQEDAEDRRGQGDQDSNDLHFESNCRTQCAVRSRYHVGSRGW